MAHGEASKPSNRLSRPVIIPETPSDAARHNSTRHEQRMFTRCDTYINIGHCHKTCIESCLTQHEAPYTFKVTDGLEMCYWWTSVTGVGQGPWVYR